MAPIVRAVHYGAFQEPFRVWFARREQELRTEWDKRADEFVRTWEMTDESWNDFWEVAATSRFNLAITSDPNEASIEDRIFAAADVKANRPTVQLHLKALLARQLYGSRVAYPLYNRIDPVFIEALTLWDDAVALAGVRSTK